MKNVTLKHFRVLSAVTKMGSMAGAARSLHVTPPAITVQIQQLEQAVGLPLLERIGDKTTATNAGQIMLRTAQRIEHLLAECRQEVERLKGVAGGHVSAGVVSTAKYFAPKALAAFRQRHPGVEVRIAVGNRQETIRALRDLELDIAIMGRPPETLDLESATLGPHPHIIVAAATHPLAGKEISISDLTNETFFIREPGSGTRILMERLFEEARFDPIVGMEIGSNETIKQAVIAGLGIAFISAHTVAVEIADGRLVMLDVAGLPMMRQWFVVRLKEKAVMPAAQVMWAFLSSEGHRFLPQPISDWKNPPRKQQP
ncbi:LysR family transcriptional regulator [Rhodomicrobium sp. Az07]|uniref:LysR family transcriptional regulator n=1 Tax=Rhodomicrobium sp. Az07 TaxID=2839034 RepID=UPI001BE7C9C4|nr:LysR family transcriptional regulator [Rhodomicrobium sp. Az07]